MSACNSAPDCPNISRDCARPAFAYNCETGFFDMAMDGCSTKTDCQVQSQIIMALYAKARDESQPQCARGGWWGGELGSRLWTLENTVISNPDDIVNRAEQYLEEALAPLVADGIIDAVAVNASLVDNEVIFDDILINRPDGQTNFSYLWDKGCT